MDKEKLIEYIKSMDWCEYSCGRSTDYCDEFDEDYSVKELVKWVEENV